jgi:NADP-dependent 3-hydroxy acid dehydrogenase YdfG
MNKIAMVTGATSGIGEATACALAGIGYDIIITGRRNERLGELKDKIERDFGTRVLVLSFDVRDHKAVKTSLGSLDHNWKNIDVLVNNAGLAAGLSRIHEGDTEDWEVMIDTNVKGLLYITREITPLMAARKSGHIVNVGSIAGKEVYEKGNVYSATKHAVDALSRSMRIDLVEYNIKVTNIAPGMVETEFSLVRFKWDKERAKKFYEGLTPLSARDIAEAIVFAVTRPPHVCINDMLIMPLAQAAVSVVKRELND